MAGQPATLLFVPTGTFMLGAPEDEARRADTQTPPHEVTIGKGYALTQTDVTAGQFREFVHASGYKPESVTQGGASVDDERTGVMRDDSNATWQDDYAGHRAANDRTVVNISWKDANAYVPWTSRHAAGKTSPAGRRTSTARRRKD